MIFLSESMTAIMLAAFEEDARNDPEVGGMPMTFLDGYVALFMPMIGFNMVQSLDHLWKLATFDIRHSKYNITKAALNKE